MSKIFISIIIMSMPNWPSVKYYGTLYTTLEECQAGNAVQEQAYLYQDKILERKAHYEMFCLEIESYPIEGMEETNNIIMENI